jgi:hypothetical protein
MQQKPKSYLTNMKKIILLFISLLICITSRAQIEKYAPYEGKFDYALLEENCFYIPFRPKEGEVVHILRKQCLSPKSMVIEHFSAGPENPKLSFAWAKRGNLAFGVDLMGFGERRSHINFNHLIYRKFETKDSVQMSNLTAIEALAEIHIQIPFLIEYYRSFKRYGEEPSSDKAVQEMYNTLNIDLYAPSPDLLQLYLRDTTTLFVWQIKLPEDENDWWRQLAVYTSPKTNYEYPPMRNPKINAGLNTQLNGIQDSLFFDGHFKVIAQGEHKFIINREHGLIYHMGDKKIVRVGHVEVSATYPSLRGKKLFIEDRDKGDILFFGPVHWEETDLPKPKTRVMTEKEMKKKFKHVL